MKDDPRRDRDGGTTPPAGTEAGAARPTPLDRLRESNLDWSRRRKRTVAKPLPGSWTRQTWTLPREQARAKAREYLRKFPRAAYATEVETWRVLPGDIIEFTMRRLPTAD